MNSPGASVWTVRFSISMQVAWFVANIAVNGSTVPPVIMIITGWYLISVLVRLIRSYRIRLISESNAWNFNQFDTHLSTGLWWWWFCKGWRRRGLLLVRIEVILFSANDNNCWFIVGTVRSSSELCDDTSPIITISLKIPNDIRHLYNGIKR